jgi:hypothetical protein
MNAGGSRWFRRLVKDCKKISPHIRIKRIKYGFYRVYWKQAYIHEIYSEMPQFGHDIYEKDINFISQKYYEEYEDRAELTRKIKNYVEGYWDSYDRIRTRSWMMKHDKEFNKTATDGYKQVVIK